MTLRLLLLAVAVFVPAAGDLPVHCVHRDILGKWKLFLGDNGGYSTATCGHHVPDRIMTMPHHHVGPLSPPFEVKRVLEVELKNPNIIVGPAGSLGTFTTVYDEGMELTLDGWKYFTFFRYSPKSPGADPTKVEQFNWHCNETVAGWFHPVVSIGTAERPRFLSSPDNWGCFVGALHERAVPADTLEGAAAAEHLGQTSTGEPVLSATVMAPPLPRFASADGDFEAAASALFGGESLLGGGGADAALFLEREAAPPVAGDGGLGAAAAAPLVLADLESTVDASSHDVLSALHSARAADASRIADAINAGGGLWQARVPTELLGSSVAELRAKLGASSTGKTRVPSHSRGAAAAAARNLHARSSQPSGPVGVPATAAAPSASRGVSESTLVPSVGAHKPVVVDVSGLPAALDWSTKDGGKYATPVFDQKACGSCYAIAAVDALTMRARIRSSALADAGFLLAPESIVRCSVYNQGCDGGYPFLVGKSAVEVGVVEGSCMPYTATQATCPGRLECALKSSGFDYAHHWKLLQSATTTAPARFAAAEQEGLRVRRRGRSRSAAAAPHATANTGVLSSKLSRDAPEAALIELRAATAGAGAAARGGGSASVTSFADLSEEMFTQDAAAAAGLEHSYGRVGPLGEDRSSPHFRARAPKLRAESNDVSSVAANTFAQSTGRLTASRYEYIGGYYGAGSESAMIRELQDGPIVVAFNSPGTLFMYRGGIFTHSMAPDVTAVDVTELSRWEKTNHAVVCVGYGADVIGGREVKWWKLKNSWGAAFGEGGYFRVVRGVDMLAIESMPVVIDV